MQKHYNILVQLLCIQFYNCTNLQKISFPKTLTILDLYIGIDYFTTGTCSGTKIVNLVLPNVEVLGSFSTTGQEQGLKGRDSFGYCSLLEEVQMPNIKRIGACFANCPKLKKVVIGSNLTYVGRYVFYKDNCKILLYTTIPPETRDSEPFGASIVYVPDESLTLYANADGWRDSYNKGNIKPLSEYTE